MEQTPDRVIPKAVRDTNPRATHIYIIFLAQLLKHAVEYSETENLDKSFLIYAFFFVLTKLVLRVNSLRSKIIFVFIYIFFFLGGGGHGVV